MIFFKAKQSQEKKRRKYNKVIRKRALLQSKYQKHIAASHKLLEQEPLHYKNEAQLSNAT